MTKSIAPLERFLRGMTFDQPLAQQAGYEERASNLSGASRVPRPGPASRCQARATATLTRASSRSTSRVTQSLGGAPRRSSTASVSVQM
jgi:hypothetical protein